MGKAEELWESFKEKDDSNYSHWVNKKDLDLLKSDGDISDSFYRDYIKHEFFYSFGFRYEKGSRGFGLEQIK